MSVVKRVRSVLGAEDAETENTSAAEADGPAAREERTTELFHCDSCGVTYVSTEMESCSQCQTSVESVPTEQDLGLL